MQTLVYRIKGQPQAIYKNSRTTRKTIDPHKLALIDAQRQLINQHDQRPLLTGPWTLTIEFYYQSAQEHQFHTHAPSITQLLRFLDEIAKGVIYNNECILHQIHAAKHYAQQEPETRLIFNRS